VAPIFVKAAFGDGQYRVKFPSKGHNFKFWFFSEFFFLPLYNVMFLQFIVWIEEKIFF
jgi:hypothetical protein